VGAPTCDVATNDGVIHSFERSSSKEPQVREAVVRSWKRYAGVLMASMFAVCVATSNAQDSSPVPRIGSFVADGDAGTLHFYMSETRKPSVALIVMHGHSRDANKTFEAGLKALAGTSAQDQTLVIAPIFQVPETHAARCHTEGMLLAEPQDLLWTCSSWLDGERATNGRRPTSFAVLDALVAEVHRQWPSVRTITWAGFSAGAQVLQHYVAFAADPPAGLAMRYVIADPGTWLYFDPVRPAALDENQACPQRNRWKYGTDELPTWLPRNAVDARARYAAADLLYLEGERDDDDSHGTAFKVLDRSCGASLQGSYRLQRGLAYSLYDRSVLSRSPRRAVRVVPGCAHDVTCVFDSDIGRSSLTEAPVAR
jgi:hypothetical protein